MSTLADLGEFGVIARLTQRWATRPDVLRGVGDDAAVLDVGNPAEVLLATCDAQVAGIHFDLATTTPQQIGRRAMAVNISDIAAMGGAPRFALISLLLPLDLALETLEGIYAGLEEEAARFGVALVGGNITRADMLALDITLLGMAVRDRLLRRDTAKAGDALLVTGTLGAAAAGLRVMQHPALAARVAAEVAAPLLAAQRTPTPRIAAGQWLAAQGVVAGLDLSDGLAADLAHLCVASGVGAEIDVAALPMLPATRVLADAAGVDARDLALYGGEDYELLIAAPPALATRIIADAHGAIGIPVTMIGHILAEPGLFRRDAATRLPLEPRGWDHLR
jgi:thiamine-monophosphate kinase